MSTVYMPDGSKHRGEPLEDISLAEAHRIRADRDRLAAENARLAEQVKRLRGALGTCSAIVDSFLNGQGAVTTEEMDSALVEARAALKE